MSKVEQTLSIIKPDAVERNLSEEINDQFLGGLNSASKNPLKEPIIFYPVSFLYHYL